MPVAIFGINNDGLNRAVSIIVLCLVVIWLALVWWTYADARRRIDDPMLVGCAALASLFFPFIGTIVYMIVRPPEYLDDVRERELEIAAAQARLHKLDPSCPYCESEIGQAPPERQRVRQRRQTTAAARVADDPAITRATSQRPPAGGERPAR